MSKLYKIENMAAGVRIAMSAQLDNIDQVCHHVAIYLSEQQLSGLAFDIQLGIREALANAIKHGAQNDPTKQVIFQINKQEKELVIMVKDDGRGFVPSTSNAHEENHLLCCGRGLTIMHHYFDKVTFNEQGNELELVKEL